MSQYFPPYKNFGGNIKVKLDLCSYATKIESKNVTHVDVSSFASKTNLASLKTKVDKNDVDKLRTVPVDSAKLSNVVKNDAVKKTDCDKLVAKVDNINTTGFVLRTKYDTEKSDPEKEIGYAERKIPDTSDLAKKTDLNAKTTEIENKMLSITGLVTNSALTAVKNKIPDVSGLVTETITQKYQILKRKLLIIIMINTLLLQNLIN